MPLIFAGSPTVRRLTIGLAIQFNKLNVARVIGQTLVAKKSENSDFQPRIPKNSQDRLRVSQIIRIFYSLPIKAALTVSLAQILPSAK